MNKNKQKLLAFMAVTANLIYLTWRIFFTLPTNASYLSIFFGYGLLLAECLGIFELFVYLHGAIRPISLQLPTIPTESFPAVDIFIATYNEPAYLLRKTILGCINMKYPCMDAVHIFLCDDGNREEMRDLANELQITYLCRENNLGAKAGNLNNALKHSISPLIATFDADMIPMEDFLMKTVPYFLENEDSIGFIQTPQSFYNADLFQSKLHAEERIPNEQDYFYRNVQLSKNRSNTVIYGGSNTVISRKALEEVGGFYEDSITEDFATGILIQSKGYRCYATSTPLASGLSPHDLKSLLKQRERWARGCIQTLKNLHLFHLKGLTITQKISYASAISYWYASMKRFFYILSPIAFTVFGIRVIHASLLEIMLFFIPTYLVTNLAIRGFCHNIRNARWTNIYETITFPSLMKCVLLETLGISEEKFSVTNKDKANEVDKDFHRKKAIPFYIYMILSVIGILNIFIYMPQYTTWNFLVLLFWLFTNLLYLIIATLFILEFHKSNHEISYKENIEFKISNSSLDCMANTIEISDTTLKFRLDNNQKHLEKNNILKASFETCHFSICIKEKKEVFDKFHRQKPLSYEYECTIINIDARSQDLWTTFLHNRLPTMPQTIHRSKHIFDDLSTTILGRMRSKSMP